MEFTVPDIFFILDYVKYGNILLTVDENKSFALFLSVKIVLSMKI